MWLGRKWPCTNISIRPCELIKIREKYVNTENRYIYIHRSKTGETKPVPILDEDVALFKQIKPGLPRSYFFRLDDSENGVKIVKNSEKNIFINVGIENIDLYGDTRRSTAVALRKGFSSKQTTLTNRAMHQKTIKHLKDTSESALMITERFTNNLQLIPTLKVKNETQTKFIFY